MAIVGATVVVVVVVVAVEFKKHRKLYCYHEVQLIDILEKFRLLYALTTMADSI
jgi:hypothetical protein